MLHWATPDAVEQALTGTGYLPGPGLATTVYLAGAMQRPVLLEGEPGTGKTSLAEAIAEGAGAELIRLQCYEGIDASQALYDWDFARQILHLRTLEATGQPQNTDDIDLFSDRFLLARPLLAALRTPNAVLLIDEIDRADDEFEAFCLQLLSDFAVSIPEYGTVTAEHPPIVVLTSNRTRELHDALKRRCLYHWIDHPTLAQEIAIVRSRLPEVAETLATQVATAVQQIRSTEGIRKPPGVAETLDWTRALRLVGADGLTAESAARTLGAVIKDRDDAMRIRSRLERILTP